jgi:hypothetical protein
MPYNNLMSSTAMTTPTPLNRPRNTRPAMSNQRIPRMPRPPAAKNVANMLPASVLARAQQLNQQRMTQMPAMTNMPTNMLAPQMNKPAAPQLQSQSLAPVESVPTNPITGQQMSPEAYQAQFGTITPPANNINYAYSLMAPPSFSNTTNPLTGQPADPTQTNQLNYMHSLPMESFTSYTNPLTGQPMTQEEYQQMLNQQMLAPGYSSNQLMPQQQIAGVQAISTQPRIF